MIVAAPSAIGLTAGMIVLLVADFLQDRLTATRKCLKKPEVPFWQVFTDSQSAADQSAVVAFRSPGR